MSLPLFAVSAMRYSFIAAIFLKPVLAAIYTDPSTLPDTSYTYIIVGGTSERQWISGTVLHLSSWPRG